MAATVLVSQKALQEGVLEAARLEQLAAAAGLRVRRVGSTQADLLVSKAGTSLPFLLWRRAGCSNTVVHSAGAASPAAVGAAAAAALKLAASFQQAYVMLPYDLLGDIDVLNTVSRSAAMRWILQSHCTAPQSAWPKNGPLGCVAAPVFLSLPLQPWMPGRGSLLCVDANGGVLHRACPGSSPGTAAS